MVRTEIQNELYPDCPIRNILARISDLFDNQINVFVDIKKICGKTSSTAISCGGRGGNKVKYVL